MAQVSVQNPGRAAPIVIRQALNCGRDGLSIYHTNITIANIVARILKTKVSDNKVVYTIKDITGTMEAVQWLFNDDSNVCSINFYRKCYAQFFGNVKLIDKKRILNVFRIIPLRSANQITFHYLQCINNKIKMENAYKKRKALDPTSSRSMYNADLGERKEIVLKIINSDNSDYGLNRSELIEVVSYHSMSKEELEFVLDSLLDNGCIYTTIDEEHFKSTVE